jgi:hypothetical protein
LERILENADSEWRISGNAADDRQFSSWSRTARRLHRAQPAMDLSIRYANSIFDPAITLPTGHGCRIVDARVHVRLGRASPGDGNPTVRLPAAGFAGIFERCGDC